LFRNQSYFLDSLQSYALERTVPSHWLYAQTSREKNAAQIDCWPCALAPETCSDLLGLKLTALAASQFQSTGVALTIRWKTAKTEELFLLLVYYQGRAKPKELIIMPSGQS
jgi:two-component SAPR family response regulator